MPVILQVVACVCVCVYVWLFLLTAVACMWLLQLKSEWILSRGCNLPWIRPIMCHKKDKKIRKHRWHIQQTYIQMVVRTLIDGTPEFCSQKSLHIFLRDPSCRNAQFSTMCQTMLCASSHMHGTHGDLESLTTVCNTNGCHIKTVTLKKYQMMEGILVVVPALLFISARVAFINLLMLVLISPTTKDFPFF